MKKHDKATLEKMKAYAVQAIQFKGDMDLPELIENIDKLEC